MPQPTKPTALKLLHGVDKVNPGRINRGEAAVPLAPNPEPPLDLDAVARDVWDHYLPILRTARLLTEADVLAFAALCQSWSSYRAAVEAVRREGPLTVGGRGQVVRNPAALVAKDSLAEFMRLAVEFGLTPSSRARISLPEAGSGDALDDLLSM
ncbi:phage terminase small subunit P27 family [Parafrankia sp. EUN1f]|uniref:phage terminase small subunit P27 family n=1 Tax=Parafrankia sp. EUN1f TaxID=102897 RepID=UPI0001C4556E|nr:phage terminase small subunit P27 family [Parafrankia sp. EUN1f]EFC86453.1 phage terminase, small subunit, P27 family [Parafrankia sp. EUN1f]